MKASELRIGNWVQGEPFSHPRLGMHSNGEVMLLANGLIEVLLGNIEYKPIPLTEEWLLKFGFIKPDPRDDTFTKELPDDGGVLELDGKLIDITPTGPDYLNWDIFHKFLREDGSYTDYNYIPCRHLKYVHTLQNLYFALTGTELEIK